MERQNENPLHADVRNIFNHALQRVLPEPALNRYVTLDPAAAILTVGNRHYDLAKFERILVVGGGKAARRTATALVHILGNRITAGVLNVYQDQAGESVSEKITLFAADHPTPNEEGAKGARRMVELLKSADAKTLVIALISGGGSSLMALPAPGVSLEDYQSISRLLLTVPATIDEINAVRKHLDPLKGGGMRKYAEHAGAFISLVLSDVPVTKTGIVDDPSVIASGPTVGDDSTFRTAYQVLSEHKIWDKSPKSIKEYVLSNLDKETNETLPKDSPLLAEDRSHYLIIANNDQAMEAAKDRAEQLGYTGLLIGWNTGTTNDKIKAEVTKEIDNIWKTITPYAVETDWITFASFSTDGIDGRSTLAGAIADGSTLAAARGSGLSFKEYLDRYDSASFFQKLGLGIEIGASGTNVADVSLVLLTNPNNPYRKTAIIFGGEATVNVVLPDGQKPGYGGRNTHLTLLAAERIATRPDRSKLFDSETVKKGLVSAGIAESQIEISETGRMGYSIDVGPISIMPLAIVGAHSHADIEKTLTFASTHGIPITARGSGSGLPGQAVGSGIIIDMRSLDKMQVLNDHPEGGKVILAQAGAICTRLNNFLKEYGVFLASYPSSTDMATIGGMIANNSSGANSCKLGTTRHQVLDLHVVLADGTSLWTSAIESGKQPWQRIVELIRSNRDTIEKKFPKVPKNSSGYNVLDVLRQLEAGAPIDWSLLFAHSEGTLAIITEAKLRAVPIPTQKATCIVYFTDLKEACEAIPRIYDIGPSCFDTAFTTNLDLIRKAFPVLRIPEAAKVMYLIEFDDLEVQQDPRDPGRRFGKVGIMEKNAAADLIAGQVDALQKLLETRHAKTTMGFEVSRDAARQDALWQGRRAALQVLYAYDPGKRPLTMIECVVLPRNEEKILAFIKYMEEVLKQEEVVAGTHGHAGDCNFHIYLLLNLTEKQDRKRLISVMEKITRKVAELGGSMSGEHADGRTRGLILPHVFGLELFDLFVKIKDLMDPRATLHPGVKIIKGARNKPLLQAIEELVGIEEKDSQLNLKRFRNYSHLYSGVCSLCSQCADTCPIFTKLSDEFPVRTESAPTFKRTLAIALDTNADAAALIKDPLFEKIFDLCLLCGQCTWKCPTNASMVDLVSRVREAKRSKVVAPVIEFIISHRGLYNAVIKVAGLTQGLWSNKLSRRVLSFLPQSLLSTHLPAERYLPSLSKTSVHARYPELRNIPASKAEIAYFTGCSTDLFDEPIVDGFLTLARHNGWNVSLPSQRCCGEPFEAAGNSQEYIRFARYNIDQLVNYKYIVTHCPTCLLAFKGYAKDFARTGDTAYEKKSLEIVNKLYDPARLIMEVIGPDNLKLGKNRIEQKVAVHVSCHEKLGHKLGATQNRTIDLLNRIPGIIVVGMKGADECCGLGGPWGLSKHYDLSVKLRQDKIANIMASPADVVTSWCQGCMIQMRDGLKQAKSKIAVRHPFELLSATYGNGGKVIG